MLYSDKYRLQEIIDSQLVIDNHWQWIQYISWVINLKFVDYAALRLISVSNSACWTVLAAAWCRFFDSDRSLNLDVDFDSQFWFSYQDNNKSD